MMKKYLTLLLMLVMAYGYAQLAAFTVNATKANDETCPSTGAISFTLGGTLTPGSTITYSLSNASGTVVTTMSQDPSKDPTQVANTFSGLVAGTYTVTATQTLGSQSNNAKSAAIVIANQKVTLTYTSTSTAEICDHDGSITINVSSGKAPYTYQLLDASNNVVISQTTNILTGLAAGTYKIRVVDQCGTGVAQSAIINDGKGGISNWYVYGKNSTDCSSTNIYLSSWSGNLKYPVTVTVNYTYNNTPQTFSKTITSGLPNVDIPYVNGATIPLTITVKDGCGNSKTVTNNFNFYDFNYPYLNNSACGGSYFIFGSYSNGYLSDPVKIIFKSYPVGFDPAVYYQDANNYVANPQVGSNTMPLPGGTYTYQTVNACGEISPVLSRDVSAPIPSGISFQVMGECGSTTQGDLIGTIVNSGKIQSVQITSAPQEFIDKFGSLPYSVPAGYIRSDGFMFTFPHIPLGNYTLAVTSSTCGTQSYSTSVKIPNYTTPTISSITYSCPNLFKINGNNGQFLLQIYNPTNGLWGNGTKWYDPSLGQDPSAASWVINGGTDIPSPGGAGLYRILANPYSVGGVYQVISNTNNTFVYCPPTVLQQFNLGGSLTFNNAYAFQCADGTYDVVLSANEGSVQLTYAIVSDGTATATIVKDNGTNPIFHGLVPGIYTFRVMDACGNFVPRTLDITKLGKPGVSAVPDCSTTPGSLKLVVNGVDYLKFEWRKTKDASGNAIASPPVIGTASILDLGTYDATDAGTYTVHMYTDPAAGYCIDNTQDMSLTVDALTAAHAGVGQTVNINYDGVTQSLDLFSYLTGPYDAFGTWTETTVPPSALLTGHSWNVAAAAPGTYTFLYTVVAPCGGATQTAAVTINLAKLCYRLPATSAAGTPQPTQFGITALGRAGSQDASNWPMARQGGWMAMEANTKGFVVNRVAFNADGTPQGIPPANFVAGMMVYDTTNKCLKIYNGTVWSCYTTQTCPN